MKIGSQLLGILCAVPRVRAVLRFEGDADAEIEDDDDDDRPRVLPRHLQTKSGQPVSPRTHEPSLKRRGLCFSLAKGADRPGRAPRRSHRAWPLRRFDERAKRRRCPLRRGHLLSTRPILLHTRKLIQVEVHTQVCVPVAFADAALSSAAHRPTCLVFAVLSSSKRPAKADGASTDSGTSAIAPTETSVLVHRPADDLFDFCSSLSASSFESEHLFVFTAPPPIRDLSAEPPPTSIARLEPSRRRLPSFEPRPLRRRSSHGQQPSRHVDKRIKRPCPPQHQHFARRLDSEPVLTALDNQPK
jgi:hypothetical protein